MHYTLFRYIFMYLLHYSLLFGELCYDLMHYVFLIKCRHHDQECHMAFLSKIEKSFCEQWWLNSQPVCTGWSTLVHYYWTQLIQVSCDLHRLKCFLQELPGHVHFWMGAYGEDSSRLRNFGGFKWVTNLNETKDVKGNLRIIQIRVNSYTSADQLTFDRLFHVKIKSHSSEQRSNYTWTIKIAGFELYITYRVSDCRQLTA